jgi:hypothetical protein
MLMITCNYKSKNILKEQMIKNIVAYTAKNDLVFPQL